MDEGRLRLHPEATTRACSTLLRGGQACTGEGGERDGSDRGVGGCEVVEFETVSRNSFTIKHDDPLSAHVTCAVDVEVAGDSYDTRVETATTMRSDLETFFICTTVKALERGAVVFDREHHATVPRNFM